MGRSLAGRRKLAREWHPTKNGSLRPSDVKPGSNRRVWWKCPAGSDHVWQTSVANRALRGSGCPFCAGMRASKDNNLARRFPALAKEWHPTMNGDLRPRDVPSGSSRRVWWKCPKGPDHEWRTRIDHRTGAGSGCPFCAGLRVSETNSLAVRFPAIAAQWHPKKNGKLTPAMVTPGTQKKVWWTCGRPGHEWQGTVANRTTRPSHCPFCSGRRVLASESLARKRPRIAKEWHPTKNGNRTPKDVAVDSARSVVWRCRKDPKHEWRTTVRARTVLGRGCPDCSGRRASELRSLALEHPELAAEWHPTKNGALRPKDILPGSGKRIFWQCPDGKDHVWRAAVHSRTHRGTGCPVCAGQKSAPSSSLAAKFPALALQWHPTKNGRLRPDEVVPGSNRRVWWKCLEGPDHVWASAIRNRTRKKGGTACPFCLGRRASVTNSLARLYPTLAREWHPTKNGLLLPRDVPSGSARVVHWKCREGPDHEWECRVEQRVRYPDCPFCAARQVSVTNCLATVAPEVAAQWHPTRNGKVRPEDVLPASHDAYWWKCSRRHVWRASVHERTVKKRGCHRCELRMLGVSTR